MWDDDGPPADEPVRKVRGRSPIGRNLVQYDFPYMTPHTFVALASDGLT